MLKYHPFHYQTFFCSFSFFNFPSLSLLFILVYIRIFQCEQAHFQLINSRLFYVKRGIYYKRLVYIINTWCEPRLISWENGLIWKLSCVKKLNVLNQDLTASFEPRRFFRAFPVFDLKFKIFIRNNSSIYNASIYMYRSMPGWCSAHLK